MTEFIRKRVSNVRNDVLSGITVSLALVPEAVAFAFVAGVDPLVGLYAAFMVGIITSIWRSSWDDFWSNWGFGSGDGKLSFSGK